MLVGMLAAACTQKPATLEFEGVAPTTIETVDAIPLPKVVVKDDSGEPLDEQPPVDWSTKPEGIVQVAGGTISPIKSGETTLIARVKDTDVKLAQPIKVQLVDRITITCEPETCRFAPGDRFRLRAQAKSGDEVVEGLSFEWTSDATRIVEAVGRGEFVAKEAGMTKVQAAARGIVAHQNVVIESPVDKLIVICPSPPSAFVAPSAASASKPSCVVKAGDTINLVTEVRGAGEVVERRASWASTNPTYVDVSGGRISGVKEGAAIVEARVENLLVSMPVEVRRAASEKCEGTFQERFETTLGDEPALFGCAESDSVRCLEKAIAKGSKKKPMSNVAVLAAARTCCCAEIPTLQRAAEAEAKSDAGPPASEGAAGKDAKSDTGP